MFGCEKSEFALISKERKATASHQTLDLGSPCYSVCCSFQNRNDSSRFLRTRDRSETVQIGRRMATRWRTEVNCGGGSNHQAYGAFSRLLFWEMDFAWDFAELSTALPSQNGNREIRGSWGSRAMMPFSPGDLDQDRQDERKFAQMYSSMDPWLLYQAGATPVISYEGVFVLPGTKWDYFAVVIVAFLARDTLSVLSHPWQCPESVILFDHCSIPTAE